jgi:hypothetical protein
LEDSTVKGKGRAGLEIRSRQLGEFTIENVRVLKISMPVKMGMDQISVLTGFLNESPFYHDNQRYTE